MAAPTGGRDNWNVNAFGEKKLAVKIGYTSENFPKTPRFKGVIDQVAIWNRALDPNELKVLYKLDGKELPDPGPTFVDRDAQPDEQEIAAKQLGQQWPDSAKTRPDSTSFPPAAACRLSPSVKWSPTAASIATMSGNSRNSKSRVTSAAHPPSKPKPNRWPVRPWPKSNRRQRHAAACHRRTTTAPPRSFIWPMSSEKRSTPTSRRPARAPHRRWPKASASISSSSTAPPAIRTNPPAAGPWPNCSTTTKTPATSCPRH